MLILRPDSNQYCLNAETGERCSWENRTFFFSDEGIYSLICHADLFNCTQPSMAITVSFRLLESFYRFDGDT